MSLGLDFYKKLIKICQEASVKPEDVLLIMTLESGLNPSAVNKWGGAAGLVQFMPFILKRVHKYNPKNHNNRSFDKLSGVEQLDYIAVHLKNLSKTGKIQSAAQLYIGNFYPVALYTSGVQSMNPGAVIVEKNPQIQKYKSVPIEKEIQAYNQNTALDYDKDGKITYGDIDMKMKNAAGSKIYKDALNMLRMAQNNQEEIVEENSIHNHSHSNDNVDESANNEFINVLKKYLQAQEESKSYFNIVGSAIEDESEYGRILSIALKQELGINSRILREGQNLQIRIDSSIDLSEFINEFNKQSVFDVNLLRSKNMNYKLATPNFQNTQYRKQILKRING
jgi:hypothetical protein